MKTEEDDSSMKLCQVKIKKGRVFVRMLRAVVSGPAKTEAKCKLTDRGCRSMTRDSILSLQGGYHTFLLASLATPRPTPQAAPPSSLC